LSSDKDSSSGGFFQQTEYERQRQVVTGNDYKSTHHLPQKVCLDLNLPENA
jgi:hypothetical protein